MLLFVCQSPPVERHIHEMRQSDDEHNCHEIRGQNADLLSERRLQQQRHQVRTDARCEHAQRQLHGPEQDPHRDPKKQYRSKTEDVKIMTQAPLNHIGHVRSSSDLGAKVFRIEFADDRLYSVNRLLTVSRRHEYDDVARTAILCYQQSFPERAFFCIFKVLRAVCQAVYARDTFNGLDSLSEASQSLKVGTRRDIGRCHTDNQLAPGGKHPVDLGVFLK